MAAPFTFFYYSELLGKSIYNNYQNDFENENLKIQSKDYYFSNVIARASKTMLDCNNSKINLKKIFTAQKKIKLDVSILEITQI